MPTGTLYIVNPAAAGGRAAEHWQRLERRLGDRATAHVVFTSATNHAFELARSEAAARTLVVAVGGDGTAREVASGLLVAGTQTPLGLIPIGTGNDFAHQAGVPDTSSAIDALREGVTRPLDVIRIEAAQLGSDQPAHALVYAAAGAAGDVLQHTTPAVKRWFGRAGAYSVGFLRAWWRLQGRVMTVRHVSGEHHGRFLLVAAGNCERAGGGAMRLSPGADPTDGQLDVTIAPHLHRLQLLRYFAYLVKGTHPGKPGIEYFRTQDITIRSAEPVEVQADGDAVGRTPARFTMESGALRVLTRKRV